MFAPLRVPNLSLKRKENCWNVSVPSSKRSKNSKDLYKVNSENAVEVEISNNEVKDIPYWDVAESKDEGDLSLSDSPASFFESSKTEDSSNNVEIFSHVQSKIGYQVECFQLNTSIDDIFNVIEDTPNFQKLVTENYYPCLEKAKQYFNAVDPIETPTKIKLKYDPHLDECLPNLKSFTDIELSFLREIACGCRPLSWDEYEKCSLIDHGYKNNNTSFGDCLKNSVTECNDSYKKRKYIIEDLKLFSHNNENENELFIIEESIDQSADDCVDLEDPLEVNCDGNPQPTQTPSTEAVLPISIDELTYLKERMDMFKFRGAKQIELADISSEKVPQIEESSTSADGDDIGSSGDIIIIQSPSKEKATSSEKKNTSLECESQTVDFIVDSIDELLKGIKPSDFDLLDVPKSPVSDKPSTSGTRKRKQRIKKLTTTDIEKATDIEKCTEYVTNMAKGLVLSNHDLHTLKQLDSKKNRIKHQETLIELEKQFVDQIHQAQERRPQPPQQQQQPQQQSQQQQQQQQQDQQSTIGDILLVIVDNL